MSEQRAPYLHVVGREDGEATVPKPGDGPDSSISTSAAISNALMYACVSWLALVREQGEGQSAQSVDLTPIGSLSYEADVLLESGERILLRVGLKVEPGLVVRFVVEPARP